jgi:hypothetical protein
MLALGGGRALTLVLEILAATTANAAWGGGSRFGGGGRVRESILRSGGPAIPSSPSFAVYRLLGNDMWPLQGVGQLRRNTAFAVKNEVAAPANVGVFWIVNRIVNATERELLVSQLKHLGVGDEQILYVDPPLAGMHCLNSKKARALFAQGLNVARNAAVAHARSMGIDWALPLDGNQFLPSDFYVNIHRALKAAESDGRVAVLLPMLRVREEQTASTHNASIDAAALAVLHVNRENPSEFMVSEPQLALHARAALDRGFSFDPKRGYGHGNKAALIAKLCGLGVQNVQESARTNERHHQRLGEKRLAHCCELVLMKIQQQIESRYYGGEFDLKKELLSLNRNLGKKSSSSVPALKADALHRRVISKATEIFQTCGATVRLFNYPDKEFFPSFTQTAIVSSANKRASFRHEAGKLFELFLEAYLKNTPTWSKAQCENFVPSEAALVGTDPDTMQPSDARALAAKIDAIRRKIQLERADIVGAKTARGAEKEANKEEAVVTEIFTRVGSDNATAKASQALVWSEPPAAPQMGPETEDEPVGKASQDAENQTDARVPGAGALRSAEAKEGLNLVRLATVGGSLKLGPQFEEASLTLAACSALTLLAWLVVATRRSARSFVLTNAVLALMCAVAAVTVFRLEFRRLKKATEVVSMSREQEVAVMLGEIRGVLDRRNRCNLLIFGLNDDASFWRDVNPLLKTVFLGNPLVKTVFLENSQKQVDKMVRKHGKSLTVLKVEYTTRMGREMMQNFQDRALWPSLRLRLPDAVESTEWDIVIVDGPHGGQKSEPGRWQSIYTAAHLWRPANALTVVEDCERKVESTFARLVFAESNLQRSLWRPAGQTHHANTSVQCYFRQPRGRRPRGNAPPAEREQAKNGDSPVHKDGRWSTGTPQNSSAGVLAAQSGGIPGTSEHPQFIDIIVHKEVGRSAGQVCAHVPGPPPMISMLSSTTPGRSAFFGNLVASFNRQDYPNKELLVII